MEIIVPLTDTCNLQKYNFRRWITSLLIFKTNICLPKGYTLFTTVVIGRNDIHMLGHKI